MNPRGNGLLTSPEGSAPSRGAPVSRPGTPGGIGDPARGAAGMNGISYAGSTDRTGRQERGCAAEIALVGRSVVDRPTVGTASELGHFFEVFRVHCRSQGPFIGKGPGAPSSTITE